MASTGQHSSQQENSVPDQSVSRACSLDMFGECGCSMDESQVGNSGQKQTIILHDVPAEPLTV